MRRIAVTVISIALALVVAAPVASGKDSSVRDSSKKTGELAAAWWQWALEKPTAPTDVNPLVGEYEGGPKCNGEPESDVSGEKWFLAGTANGEAVMRHCTVPAGAQIFFPIANVVTVEGWDSADGDVEPLRPLVNYYTDTLLDGATMFATLDKGNDGKDVKDVLGLSQRAESPLFTVNVPDENVYKDYGLQEGTRRAVTDGVWLTLPPLPEGEHEINFGGDFPNFGFQQNNTYILTVQDEDDG